MIVLGQIAAADTADSASSVYHLLLTFNFLSVISEKLIYLTKHSI